MKTNVCNIQNTRVMLLTINTLQMLKIIYTNVNLKKKKSHNGNYDDTDYINL